MNSKQKTVLALFCLAVIVVFMAFVPLAWVGYGNSVGSFAGYGNLFTTSIGVASQRLSGDIGSEDLHWINTTDSIIVTIDYSRLALELGVLAFVFGVVFLLCSESKKDRVR